MGEPKLLSAEFVGLAQSLVFGNWKEFSLGLIGFGRVRFSLGSTILDKREWERELIQIQPNKEKPFQ